MLKNVYKLALLNAEGKYFFRYYLERIQIVLIVGGVSPEDEILLYGSLLPIS